MLSTTLRPPGVCMKQKSQSKFLPWPGFEPRTSYLGVQHTTARPLRPLKTIYTTGLVPAPIVLYNLKLERYRAGVTHNAYGRPFQVAENAELCRMAVCEW